MIETLITSLETASATVKLSKRIWTSIASRKISICYDQTLNGSKENWEKLITPSKNAFSENPELTAYFFEIAKEKIKERKRNIVDFIIPTPLVAIFGMAFGKRIKVVNNSTSKKMRKFSKKGAEWKIIGSDFSNKIEIIDNASIKSKLEITKIELQSKDARGAVKTEKTISDLKNIFNEYIKNINSDQIDIYLNCSPVSAYAIGEILKTISKEVSLYHFNNKTYEKMIIKTVENKIIFNNQKG